MEFCSQDGIHSKLLPCWGSIFPSFLSYFPPFPCFMFSGSDGGPSLTKSTWKDNEWKFLSSRSDCCLQHTTPVTYGTLPLILTGGYRWFTLGEKEQQKLIMRKMFFIIRNSGSFELPKNGQFKPKQIKQRNGQKYTLSFCPSCLSSNDEQL